MANVKGCRQKMKEGLLKLQTPKSPKGDLRLTNPCLTDSLVSNEYNLLQANFEKQGLSSDGLPPLGEGRDGVYILAFNSSRNPLIFSKDCIITNFSSAFLFFFK